MPLTKMRTYKTQSSMTFRFENQHRCESHIKNNFVARGAGKQQARHWQTKRIMFRDFEITIPN